MRFRKLNQGEHEQTKWLYETVFFEDDQKFVDYYYTWKIRDNLVFVAEDEHGIHAMIHLNPFDVWVKGQIQRLHYIVAVATQKEYRHQGLMRQLLELVEKEMAENKESFTFLMPASEKIYLPFGYRYFSYWRKGILDTTAKEALLEAAEVSADLNQKRSVNGTYYCREIQAQDYQNLADVMNGILQRQYEVFVYRNSSYYERLKAEQECQNGSVILVMEKQENGMEEIVGSFCTGNERELSIREIILAPEKKSEGIRAIKEYIGGCQKFKVFGCNCSGVLQLEELTPLMMGKSLTDGEVDLDSVHRKIFLNEIV